MAARKWRRRWRWFQWSQRDPPSSQGFDHAEVILYFSINKQTKVILEFRSHIFESKVNFLCWKFCWLACCCQWGILVRATPTRSEAHKLKLFLIKTWSAVQKHESPIYIKKRGVPQVYIWMANRRGCKEHWPEKKSNQNKEPCPVQMSNVAFKSFCRQIRQNARITVRVGLSSHSWQCQDFESVRYNSPPLRGYLLVTGLGASGCYCVEKD